MDNETKQLPLLDGFTQTRIYDNPDAYALTQREALRLDKINGIIWKFFNVTNPEFVHYDISESGEKSKTYLYSEQSIPLLKHAFEASKISINNAYKLANRIINSKWFSVFTVKSNDLAFITNDEAIEVCKQDQYPELYKIWGKNKILLHEMSKYKWEVYDSAVNAEGLRLALNLPEEYKYLSAFELDTLKLIIDIVEFVSVPFTQHEGLFAMPNTNGTTALNTVGTKALNNSYYDDINEQTVITTTKGVRITINDKLANVKSTAYGNMDRLVRHMTNIMLREGFTSEDIIITLDEFKKIRKLKDDKTARAQLNKAAKDLYNLSVRFTFKNETIDARYIDVKSEIENSSIKLHPSLLFTKIMRENDSITWIPEGFLAIPVNKTNAYNIAMYLADQKRRALGQPNEDIVSVMTLLDVTTLPTFDVIKPNRYRQQIINPFFNALDTVVATGEITYEIIGLTSDERSAVYYDYKIFKKAKLKINWVNEHESYGALRDRKQKLLAMRKQKRLEQAAGVTKPKRKRKAE